MGIKTDVPKCRKSTISGTKIQDSQQNQWTIFTPTKIKSRSTMYARARSNFSEFQSATCGINLNMMKVIVLKRACLQPWSVLTSVSWGDIWLPPNTPARTKDIVGNLYSFLSACGKPGWAFPNGVVAHVEQTQILHWSFVISWQHEVVCARYGIMMGMIRFIKINTSMSCQVATAGLTRNSWNSCWGIHLLVSWICQTTMQSLRHAPNDVPKTPVVGA